MFGLKTHSTTASKKSNKMAKFIMTLISRISPLMSSNSIIHEGHVLTVAPVDLRIGQTVITPNGLGEIKFVILDWISSKPEYVDVLLYRGYIKRYKVFSLQQYVVLHKPSGQFIKLSSANYRYIYMNRQPVNYRVTNRLYAQLTNESKTESAYVKTLNKQRGGLHCLRVLTKYNLEIKKKGK